MQKKKVRTWNIKRIIDNLKYSLVLNKMILIKSFLNGALDDCFGFICTYLNLGDKVCECYSYLNMMIQAHLHVGSFTIFLVRRTSLKGTVMQIDQLKSCRLSV